VRYPKTFEKNGKSARGVKRKSRDLLDRGTKQPGEKTQAKVIVFATRRSVGEEGIGITERK